MNKQAVRNEILLALGITREAVQGCLASGSLEHAQEALKQLKASARKRFRQLSAGIHPDHSDQPEDHERFKIMSEVMSWLDGLDVAHRPQPRPPRPRPQPSPWEYQTGNPFGTTYTTTTSAYGGNPHHTVIWFRVF
jgi:hypothetical protein